MSVGRVRFDRKLVVGSTSNVLYLNPSTLQVAALHRLLILVVASGGSEAKRCTSRILSTDNCDSFPFFFPFSIFIRSNPGLSFYYFISIIIPC